MQLSRLKTLLGLKLLALIVLGDIANESNNWLIKEDACLDKPTFITFSQLLISDLVQNVANILQHGINH